jgi:uncharacterized protein YndB with AHSA1/START domain
MAQLTIDAPENSQNILGVATIQAPLEKVFKAFVDKDLFAQWFVRGNNMTIHAFDARSGGAWHISEHAPDGNDYGFCGSYHEVAEDDRIIWTFEFLGMPERGHVSMERADFIAINDTTTELRTLSTFFSVEDRDGMIASGMEGGWRESLDALEKLLGSER